MAKTSPCTRPRRRRRLSISFTRSRLKSYLLAVRVGRAEVTKYYPERTGARINPGAFRDWIHMAQRRIVELIDDLDETIIEDGGTQTFALNGTTYEIDLSTANAEKMREALAPFIEAGRRVRRIPSSRRAKTGLSKGR